MAQLDNPRRVPMNSDLETRIYASALRSVLWGSPRSEVLQMLEANGITGDAAEEILRRAAGERVALLRGEAIRKAGKGALLLVAGVTLFCIFWFGFGAITRSVFIIFSLLGGWGAWRLLDGVLEAIRAPSKEGSVSSDI
jgi:hypothetical protein